MGQPGDNDMPGLNTLFNNADGGEGLAHLLLKAQQCRIGTNKPAEALKQIKVELT